MSALFSHYSYSFCLYTLSFTPVTRWNYTRGGIVCVCVCCLHAHVYVYNKCELQWYGGESMTGLHWESGCKPEEGSVLYTVSTAALPHTVVYVTDMETFCASFLMSLSSFPFNAFFHFLFWSATHSRFEQTLILELCLYTTVLHYMFWGKCSTIHNVFRKMNPACFQLMWKIAQLVSWQCHHNQLGWFTYC